MQVFICSFEFVHMCVSSFVLLCCLVFRLNSPAIVYKTTRNVIPTFENINAVKARQWSFARSNGGFCLRRTDRLRSILLPFPTLYAGCLQIICFSLVPASAYKAPNRTWYPLINIICFYVFNAPSSKKACGLGGKIEIGLIHLRCCRLILFWS